MKRWCLLALAMVVGCGEDTVSAPDGAGEVSATIAEFPSPYRSFAGRTSVFAERSKERLTIFAKDTTGAYMMFILMGDITKEGVYPFYQGTNFASLDGPPYSHWSAVSGSMRISKLTESRVAGTFNFIAEYDRQSTSKLNVLAGEFNLRLTQTSP